MITSPGQRTTTHKGEAPTRPAPIAAPDRTVTVTVADPDALVVDALGRANGMRDGRKILQTPGAQLRLVDGHLVITLPDVPDGALSTHLGDDSRRSDVTTKVEDRGKPAVELSDTVAPGSGSGVEIKRGSGSAPSIEKNDRQAPSPKVGKAPPTPAATTLGDALRIAVPAPLVNASANSASSTGTH